MLWCERVHWRGLAFSGVHWRALACTGVICRAVVLCYAEVLDNRNPLPDNSTQITWIIFKNSSALMCVFLKLFVHDLLYKFIDSSALACTGVLWRALACSGVHWRALACSVVLWRALLCRNQVLDNRNPLPENRTQITWIILHIIYTSCN